MCECNNDCRCRPCGGAGFSFIKTDGATGLPLAGARFTLSRCGAPVASSVSNGAGAVTFRCLEPGTYQLIELFPPAGYAPDAAVYEVSVDCEGAVFINGLPAAEFSIANEALESVLLVRYIDETGAEVFPGQRLVVEPGPYSVPAPPTPVQVVGDCSVYRFLDGTSGAPTTGVIAQGETLIVQFDYALGQCGPGTLFDPALRTCSASYVCPFV